MFQKTGIYPLLQINLEPLAKTIIDFSFCFLLNGFIPLNKIAWITNFNELVNISCKHVWIEMVLL